MAERQKQRTAPADGRARRSISLEDAHLVALVQSGQTEAFGELVRRYDDRIFNTCWRICGNLEDARDLTQDAFIRALERIDGFEGKSAFYTWLFRVAVNLALSHKRRAGGRRVVSLDQTEDADGSQAESLAKRVRDLKTLEAGERAEEAERQRCVVQALNALADDHRAVLVLRDVEGFDYQEIAAVLEVPAGTVKSRLHRARMAMREALLPLLRQER